MPGAHSCRFPLSGQTAQDAQRCRQPRYGIETFIAGAPGGPSPTRSEVIFSDAPAVLGILRLPEARTAGSMVR
jgi:hypothetical protein